MDSMDTRPSDKEWLGFITVRQLIEQLQKVSPDAVVICSGDDDGNNCSPFRYLETSFWVTGEYSHGCRDDSEEMDRAVPAVMIYPT